MFEYVKDRITKELECVTNEYSLQLEEEEKLDEKINKVENLIKLKKFSRILPILFILINFFALKCIGFVGISSPLINILSLFGVNLIYAVFFWKYYF